MEWRGRYIIDLIYYNVDFTPIIKRVITGKMDTL